MQNFLSLRSVCDNHACLEVQLAQALNGGDAASSDESVAYSGPPVFGEIVEVTQDVNGRPVARIDLGSNDAIRANMKLFISRGDQFLANLIVLDTDLNTAVGPRRSAPCTSST